MKLAALIFGDDDRHPKTAAGKSPEPGQIVRSIDGSVYRVASKIAGPDGIVVKLANLQGKPVQTPTNFHPVGLAVARFASWLRYHLAYQKDFDLYVNAYIEQYNNQHKDNPLPYPVGDDGQAFRWANWFQKTVSPKLFIRGRGNVEDQQAVKDDIIHEMLFNTLGERHVLDQFVAKAKSLGVNRQNGAAKLRTFLISTFMYRIDEMQNKLNARSPEEEISMYQPGQSDEGDSEVNILETEQHGVGEAEFQGTEARRDVSRFRESFRKWLGHTAGPKASENFILMFDIFWRLLQANQHDEVKRSELQEEWIEKTGLSFGSFKDYFTRLPEMMESFIVSHQSELGEKSIFVELMNAIRAERTERERKERRQQKQKEQKARPAMVSSLKIAEGIEEDVEEAQDATVSPMKVADGIGGDLAQAISNSENPDVVDPDIKQPTKTVPEAAKQAGGGDDYGPICPKCNKAVMTKTYTCPKCGHKNADYVKTAQNLVRGDQLDAQQKQQVLNAFPYRWTKENPHRVTRECPNCDVYNAPFEGSSAAGHNHPTIPLQSDDQWVREHAFWFTNAGKLFPRRSATPASYAPEPETEGLFASVAHRFAMDKSRKQADFACCDGWGEHKSDCSVKDTDSTSKHTAAPNYMTPGQMIQEFNRPGGQGDQIRSGEPRKEEPSITTKMRRGLGDPAIERKEGMLGHDFDNADGQAIGDETLPDTGREPHQFDTTELKQRRVATEIWKCEDCGAEGPLDPVGGGCATCGSQAIGRVDQSKPADLVPIREPNPMEVEKRMIPRREKRLSPGDRLIASEYPKSTCDHCGVGIYKPLPESGQWMHQDTHAERCGNRVVLRTQKPTYATPKTAQGSGNTTVTMQNQNVTAPGSPNKAEPMAVPEAIDQTAGPHSPNAPMTAPRTPGITPKIVNVPPGTEGEMGNMASAKTADGFEQLFSDLLSEYACPRCQSVNVDVTPTEEGYDIYCEDCEQTTPSHAGATPGVSGFPANEPEVVDPDLEMEPEEPPFEHQHEGADKTADALFEEQPLADVTDIDMLFTMPEERKAEWLKAHGWSPDKSHHGPAWWLRQPQWTKDGHEEDIPYQGTDEAIEKELELQEKEDDRIEAKGIGCRQCGAILNNAEGDLCGQCQAEGAEDREDPFDKESAEEGEDKMQVAKTILEQLGGNKFRVMTGAKNFVGGQNDLSFRLPGGNFSKGINAVRITLESSDTYTVTFMAIRAGAVKTVSEHSDIYAENLREVFERATGLATSLGTMGKSGAGSNSGDDDARGVGDLYREEFYEHRTEGLSSEGMLSGMKEAAPAVAPSVAQAPNVAQNMNLVKPQPPAPGTPGATMAIMPGEDEDQGGIKRHTVEPDLPNAKYHMQGALIAAEEERLMKEAKVGDLLQCKECGKIDPSVEWYDFPDLGNISGTGPYEAPLCLDCATGVAQDI